MKGNITKYLKASGQYAISLAIILLFIIAFVRLFFPYLDHYKEYFEHRASEALHQPVEIGTVEASWRGVFPIINLNNMAIYDKAHQVKLLQVQHLQLVPDIWDSLLQRRIIVSRLHLSGTKLSIRQLDNNNWDVNGIKTTIASGSTNNGSLQNALTWFHAQGKMTISNVDIDYWHSLNGLEFSATNAQLKLSVENMQRVISLDANNINIKLEKLFYSPFKFDYAHIVFNYPEVKTNSEIFLKEFWLINKDLEIAGRMRIHKNSPQDPSTFIQLIASISGKNIASLNNYTPQFLQKGLTDWLKTALIKSDHFQGEILIQGPVNQFPYANHHGRFKSIWTIENLDLNYHHDWPIVTNMSANLVFDNESLKIAVTNGKTLNMATGAINVDIPNLKHPVLNIHWNSLESYQNLSKIIASSPLQHMLGKTLKYINYEGPSKLGLDISIPIHKNNSKEIKVAGKFELLPHGVLKIPEYQIALSKLQGSLQFTEDTLSAKAIKGLWLGQPIELNINTIRKEPLPAEINIDATGTLDFVNLEKNYKLDSLSKVINGKSAYTALLKFFTGKEQPHNVISINTNLSGTRIDLPEPLNKTASEAIPSTVELTNLASSHLFTINYGKKLNAVVDLRTNAERNWTVDNANIQLGNNINLPLPKTPSVIIVGKFSQFNLEAVIKQFSSGAQTGNFAEKWSAFLEFLGPNSKRIDLGFDQLNVYGMMIHQANIKINEINNALKFKIASQEIVGSGSIPNNLATKPIQGVFQRFYFDSSIDHSLGSGFTEKLSPQDNSVNPGNIPSLYLLFENFYYNKHPLGEICLITTRQKNAMKIQEFTVDFPHFSLFSTGQWNFGGGKQHTFFTGHIKTTSLGEFLSNWGITQSVRGAKGTADFSLNWDGPAYNPDANKLNGQVKLAFEKGEIVKVIDKPSDSGIGLILNLLTFEILKQIFTPSARENSKKGDLDFSVLTSDLVIKNGNAYTDNIFLDGEMAKVKSTGRIGLGAQDYDLLLYVTPYVASAIVPGSSLPVIGSMIRGSLKIVNKTIGSVLNGFFKRTYHVIGPWANPSFDRIAS